MRRLILILLTVAVLIGAIAYSQYRSEPDRVSGFIEAHEIRVGSRVGGRVQAVPVEEGERVTVGQILVELEPFDVLEREKEAAATLAALDANYRRLVAGLRPEEIGQARARYDQSLAELDRLEAGAREQEIEAARGRLQVAESELQFARQNFERRTELFQQDAIPREEFESAKERFASAEAMVVVRKEELDLLKAGPRKEEIRKAAARASEAKQAWELAVKGSRQETIEEAKASRDAARAALDAIGQQKKELTIVSPVDGTIEALDLRPGDLAPAGAPVLSIMDNSRLWVRAYVPQNRVGLQVGDELRVTVDSLPGERFRGKVTFISRQAEFTPGNVQTPEERAKQVFRVKVELQDRNGALHPGMTADVWLDPVGDPP